MSNFLVKLEELGAKQDEDTMIGTLVTKFQVEALQKHIWVTAELKLLSSHGKNEYYIGS